MTVNPSNSLYFLPRSGYHRYFNIEVKAATSPKSSHLVKEIPE